MSNDPLIDSEIDGRYLIEECIGSGGMGTVYRARHLLLDTTVALKVINPALATTPEMRERFLREAKAASALSHTNIVTVRDVGQF
ncbi:MAG: protein kinase, partial [Planctomycetales bacterium]